MLCHVERGVQEDFLQPYNIYSIFSLSIPPFAWLFMLTVLLCPFSFVCLLSSVSDAALQIMLYFLVQWQ